MKDLFLIVFLVTLIWLRWKSDDASWMGLISYVGVLIALGDLFFTSVLKYKDRNGISYITVFGIAVGIILIIVLGNVFEGTIILDTKLIDILTLLALAISLPQNFYIRILDVLLKETEEVKKYE